MENKKAKVLLLGSSGSIGTSTLNCVRRYSDRFEIVALAAGKRTETLVSQIREFNPQAVYTADPQGEQIIRKEFPDLIVYTGNDGLSRLVEETEADIVLNALVGAVGLRPTVAAIKAGRRVALANKESLVIGGDYIRKLLAEGKSELLPVDSEHSAILQCLSGEKIIL